MSYNDFNLLSNVFGQTYGVEISNFFVYNMLRNVWFMYHTFHSRKFYNYFEDTDENI